MKYRINIRREIKVIIVLAVIFGLIAFAERATEETAVQDVRVVIENVHENHFLEERDVLELMQIDRQNIRGAVMEKLNLKTLEEKMRMHPFIEDAQVYGDLKGNLIARVTLRRPVARMVRNDGADGYIAEDGTVMPVSQKYTSRVLLLTGAAVPRLIRQKNLNETDDGKKIMAMIEKITGDEFWNAQITQLDIDNKLRITLYPQVGNEVIEFGKPEDIDTRFKKLKIFYKEILPKVGWNKYDRVNLEYEGQIVAE